MALMTQDSGGAMLHNDGGTWVNGSPAPNSSAIFPHDSVQTQKEKGAKIDADGSTITVQPDTLLQFGTDELVLEDGSLQLNTSREMKVHANCITITPLVAAWTRYDVVDVDDKVTVIADENDVKIHYERGSALRSKQGWPADVTVHQGEQVTRDERCGAPAKPAGQVSAAGAIMNNPGIVGGAVLVIGLTCLLVCHDDDPASPYKP